MKSVLKLDQYCDLSTVTPEMAGSVAYKVEHGEKTAYYPKGTEFTGPTALFLCHTGQASPADEECKNAFAKTAEEIEARVLEYEMTAKGIHDKGARELYKAGVILGYNADGTQIPGPEYNRWQAAMEAEDDKE